MNDSKPSGRRSTNSSAPPNLAAWRILSSLLAFSGSPRPMFSAIFVPRYWDTRTTFSWIHLQITENGYSPGTAQRLRAVNLLPWGFEYSGHLWVFLLPLGRRCARWVLEQCFCLFLWNLLGGGATKCHQTNTPDPLAPTIICVLWCLSVWTELSCPESHHTYTEMAWLDLEGDVLQGVFFSLPRVFERDISIISATKCLKRQPKLYT